MLFGVVGSTNLAPLKCGVTSSAWLLPALGSLVWLMMVQGGRSEGHVTQFSHLSWMPPNHILFCSIDDDSDLYSPRYSFSEDSK